MPRLLFALRRLSVAMAISSACFGTPEQSGMSHQPVGDSGLASGTPAPSLDSLIAQLANVRGTFQAAVPALGSFQGDPTPFRAFESLGQPGLERLVECMARTDTAQASYRGRPMTVGMVCYAALARLIYYEAEDDERGVTPRWPGHIDLGASPAQQRAAQAAWREVVLKRRYSTI